MSGDEGMRCQEFNALLGALRNSLAHQKPSEHTSGESFAPHVFPVPSSSQVVRALHAQR